MNGCTRWLLALGFPPKRQLSLIESVMLFLVSRRSRQAFIDRMGAKASKAKQAKDRQGKLEKVEAQLDAARQLVGGQRHQPKLQLAAARRSGAAPPGQQLTAPACRSRARGSIRHSRRRATSCCSSSRTRRSATRRAARTFCRASACSCAAGCGSWCAAPTARVSRRRSEPHCSHRAPNEPQPKCCSLTQKPHHTTLALVRQVDAPARALGRAAAGGRRAAHR